jgi:hypothetical protein
MIGSLIIVTTKLEILGASQSTVESIEDYIMANFSIIMNYLSQPLHPKAVRSMLTPREFGGYIPQKMLDLLHKIFSVPDTDIKNLPRYVLRVPF